MNSPVRALNRHDRQAIAATQQHHAAQFLGGVRAQLIERDDAREAALQLHVDHEPARSLRVAVGIVVGVAAVEGASGRDSPLSRLHDADDARHLAARVVEKGLIAALHLVAQHVARLVVAHAVPAGGAPRRARQMLDAEARRLGLQQPVAASARSPFSVTTASSGTSWRRGDELLDLLEREGEPDQQRPVPACAQRGERRRRGRRSRRPCRAAVPAHRIRPAAGAPRRASARAMRRGACGSRIPRRLRRQRPP